MIRMVPTTDFPSPSAIARASDSNEVLRNAIRDMLTAQWPSESAVEASGSPERRAAVLRQLGAQGWGSLGTDPEMGGMSAVVTCMEELGRAGCPAPLLEVVLINLALHDIKTSARVQLALEALRTGHTSGCFALASFDGDAGAGRVSAHEVDDITSLSGNLAGVENAHDASHIAVLLDTGALAWVDVGTTAGLSIQATSGFAVPPLSRLMFDNVSAELIGLRPGLAADLALLMRLGVTARALGASRRGFDLVVDYAKQRVQFGNPIGHYQAIQHKLVDCLIAIEGTRLLLLRAAVAWDMGDPLWRYATTSAVAFASPALRKSCLEIHHACGGIGFWEDHEMPRHFRRIHADLLRFGGVHGARAETAGRLLSNTELETTGHA